MILSEQLLAIFFCLMWGFSYILLFTYFKKFLCYSKYKLIYNIIFSFILTILFFIGIVKLNNGILNTYYLLFIFFGFIIFKLFCRFF